MMAFKALIKYAESLSGISKFDSEAIDRLPEPLAELIGKDKIESLSRLFYNSVYSDEEWFRSIFASSTKEEAIRNQVDFLFERFGGTALYSERKGRHRIIGRHAPYKLNDKSAARWIQHMESAIKQSDIKASLAQIMMDYFKYMAYFLVAGVSMMNCTHLIDYEKKMAKNRQIPGSEII